jgi:hypothetical protein
MTNLHPMNEANCPISTDVLAELYRSDAGMAANLVEALPETQRIELAMFCYSRAHLRPLAMSIATKCDTTKLMLVGGNAGYALALQCQHTEGTAFKARISLGGTRH